MPNYLQSRKFLTWHTAILVVCRFGFVASLSGEFWISTQTCMYDQAFSRQASTFTSRPCAAEHHDSSHVQSCLSTLADGAWSEASPSDLAESESEPRFIWSPSDSQHERACREAVLTTQTAGQCLDRKWMMIIGDSSTRMLFSGLVQLLNGSSQGTDPHFPSHRPCSMCEGFWPEGSDNSECCKRFMKGQDHGDDATSDYDAGVLGYHREFWSNGIRVTFSFKSLAELPVAAILRALISPSQQPDILVLQFGAWDLYQWNAVDYTIPKAMQYITSLQDLYHGPLVWVTLPECGDSPHQKEVTEFNNGMIDELSSHNISVLSRGASTRNLPSGLVHQCKWFHAQHIIADHHAQWLLRAIC